MQTFPVARLRQPFVPIHGFMGQAAQAVQPATTAGMTKDQAIAQKNVLLNAAAAEMINSAARISNNLDKIYYDYTHFELWSWIRTVASQVLLPAIGPLADAWMRSSDAQKARIIIMSSLSIAQKWMNEITEKFLPVFLDEIEAMNPDLAKQIDRAFETVSIKFRRNTDLMIDVSGVPQVWLGRGASIFFPELWKQLGKTIDRIAEITLALEALIKAFANIMESAGKAAKVAPYFVLGGIGIIAIWLLAK